MALGKIRAQELLWVSSLLGITVFLVHFLHFRQFGFYEDDWWSIAASVGRSPRGLFGIAKYQFQHWPQGRPLNHFLPLALGRIGWRLGGLRAIYLIAALWLTLNSLLAYCVSRNVLPPASSLVVAAAYVLYPADTTKILLIHASHVQGSMTFLFAGLLLWFADGWYRRASYLVAGLSLLSYETAYLPFLCAPLLITASRTHIRRTWLSHLILCGATLGVVTGVRLRLTESRVADAAGHLGQSIYRSVTSMFIGPVTGIAALVHALFIGYTHVNAGILSGIILFAMLSYVAVKLRNSAAIGQEPSNNEMRRQALLTARAALFTWPVAYALTLLYYPPTQLTGRTTSTHIAAGWPFALLAGSLALLIASYTAQAVKFARIIAGVLFVGLCSYHAFLQSEYARAWQIERSFWTQVVALTPDITRECSVMVQGSLDPRASKVILANSWADEEAYWRILGIDDGRDGPFLAHIERRVLFRKRGGILQWQPEDWNAPKFVSINTDNLILLESHDGVLRRVQALDLPIGTVRSTRPIPSQKGTWPPSAVSGLMQPR